MKSNTIMTAKTQYFFKILLIIVIFFLSNCAYCTNNQFTSENFSQNNKFDNESYRVISLANLPSKDLNYIYKDHRGFMWLGTLDGLFRYDGYNFKRYTFNYVGNGLSSNMIYRIAEDSKGNIWVSTYGKGLCRINPIKDEITNYSVENGYINYPMDIASLTIDDRDILWVGGIHKIYRISLNTQKYIKKIDVIETKELSEDCVGINDIIKTKDDEVWASSNNGIIQIINPYGAKPSIKYKFLNYNSENFGNFDNGFICTSSVGVYVLNENDSLKYINSNSCQFLLNYKKEIWLTCDKGVFFLKKINKKWEKIHLFDLKEDTEGGLGSNSITCISADNAGRIWVGTRGGGVSIIEKSSQKFEHYTHSSRRGSLSGNDILCVYEDHKENLWIGTEDGSLSFLPKGGSYKDGFVNLNVNSKGGKKRVNTVIEIKTPESKEHKSVIYTGSNVFNYLTVVDPSNLKVEVVKSDIKMVFCFENVGDSVLWIGTYNSGLWKAELDKNGKIVKYKKFIKENTEGLASNIIREIFKDSQNNIWIGTDKGLSLINSEDVDKENPRFEYFGMGITSNNLPFDYILQIVEDKKDGSLWMGTMGGGLLHCKPGIKGYEFTALSVYDGIPNNSIKSIVIDDEFLWLSTNDGISRYNPENGEIINYFESDGLQDNQFSEIAGIKRRNGDIVMGGIDGINVFRRGKSTRKDGLPKIFFTNLQVKNKEIKVGEKYDGNIILSKNLDYQNKIELNYSQNSFAVDFVGLYLSAPKRVKYKYILLGFEKQWNKTTSDYRKVKYTNLPSGKYKLQVMACNASNEWVEKPACLSIIVRVPLYRSWWAIIIYLLLIVIIFRTIYHLIKEINDRNSEIEIANIQKEKIKEVSKLKMQFFTNISHEFKTPLTLISGPLNDLIKNEFNFSKEERQKYYRLMQNNIKDLQRLINQLMDFRRLDNGKLKLQVSNANINNVVCRVYDTFSSIAKSKGIKFSLELSDSIPEIMFDIVHIEQVLNNLVSNSYKFTSKGGSIVIKTVDKEDKILVSVIDTGMGVREIDRKHLFERYFQSNNKNSGGTGIGLAYSKDIIDLHDGKIWFDNNINGGSIFNFELKKKINLDNPKIKLLKSDTSHDTLNNEKTEINNKRELDDSKKTLVDTLDEKADIIEKKYLILIVDDNIEMLSYLKNSICRKYNVITAQDGKEGLDKCRKENPDLVVSDIMMPIMDGITMCESIKNDEEISHIPIILLSAKTTDDTKIKGFSLGADAYVEKPFNINVLLAHISTLLKNKEQLRHRYQKEIEFNPMLVANTPADSKFIDKIMDIINENVSDSDFSIEQLASAYGVSRVYLNRKIKSLTGETSTQFLRNIRLKHAASLLEQGVLNVMEITWKVGYNDMATFRKRFKEKFGCSPSEYAKKNAEKNQNNNI